MDAFVRKFYPNAVMTIQFIFPVGFADSIRDKDIKRMFWFMCLEVKVRVF